MILNHLVHQSATVGARITRTLPTQCNPRHLLPGGISIAIAVGGSRYDNAPKRGIFKEQEMSEQMFYAQVMQELHEQEDRAAPAQQEAQEAVATEIEVKNYFGE